MHGPTCIFRANLTPFSLQDPAAAAERELRELLGRHHLEAYAAPLLELGVAAPRHLLDLEEEDVAELGMRKLEVGGGTASPLSFPSCALSAQGWGAQARRFHACIEELQGVDRGAI